MLDKKIADPETEPEKKKMHTKAKDAVVSALETLGDSTDRSALVALCNAAKDPLSALLDKQHGSSTTFSASVLSAVCCFCRCVLVCTCACVCACAYVSLCVVLAPCTVFLWIVVAAVSDHSIFTTVSRIWEAEFHRDMVALNVRICADTRRGQRMRMCV